MGIGEKMSTLFDIYIIKTLENSYCLVLHTISYENIFKSYVSQFISCYKMKSVFIILSLFFGYV